MVVAIFGGLVIGGTGIGVTITLGIIELYIYHVSSTVRIRYSTVSSIHGEQQVKDLKVTLLW